MPDNFCIEVVHDRPEVLEQALAICMCHNQKVTHFLVHKGSLVLFWHHPGDTFAGPKFSPGVQSFPTPLGIGALVVMVKEWLSSQPDEAFAEYLDCDGSIKRGFRVHNGEKPWGHVLGSPYSVCAVEPHWTWYGK